MVRIINEPDERQKKREKLFSEIKGLACSCDLMCGWICHFCKELSYKLREIMGLK